LTFTGSDNYLRIPLAAFAKATSDSKCQLQITYLNYKEVPVILGGMFF